MLSGIGSVTIIGTEKAYARMGQDVNGDLVENTNIYRPTDHPIYYYQPPIDENGNHDYFAYPIYDDPQDITDEEFFGVWNEKLNEWVNGPYLRYSAFPGLEKVEEASKASDYETAKVELLAYYQQIGSTRGDSESYGSVSGLATQVLEAMSRNIFSYSMISALPIGGFEIPENEFEKISIAVEKNVVSGFVGSYNEFSVEIASGDKFWTTAEIYTKEAPDESLRPYLSAIVNGIYREFEVNKDGMVVAGSSADINYGTDPVAYVEEHGTFDNIDGSYGSYDATTKRYFLSFDISDLKSADTVKNVQIHLTARNIISDETKLRFSDENGKLYEGEADRPKFMWATWYKGSAWQEDELVWNTSTIQDKMYFSCNDMEAWDYITSSDPNTKGKVCGFHRDNDMGNLRSAWMASKDERFAYTYIRQEMALINSIGCEPNVMNSLDMSTHMSGLSSSFYAFLDSKYFTPDVCTAWLKFMWQLCDWQVESYYGTSNNNWGTFASGAVYDGVARFPEFFTHDYWYERTLEDNTRMLGIFTMDDGLCIEQSHGYIGTILTTMATPLDTMIRTGHEGPYDEELYQVIYDSIKSLIYTSGPYFGGFNNGDGYDPYTSYASHFSKWYQLLFPDDENLEWLVSGGTSGKMPENPTTVYPLSYKTFMRSGWDEKSLQMSFINVSDSRRSHYHDDQLSIAMFAYGKYLLVDPGYGADQTSDGGRVWLYNKSPVQHNVVTINDTYDYLYDDVCAMTSVAPNSSGSRDFETNKYYDYQEYYNTGYNTSPLMQRSVTFLKEPGFWIVSDYNVPNEPEKENTFAQHWHTYPDANMEYDDNYVVRTNYDGPNVTIVPIEKDELDDVRWVDCYYSEKAGMKVIAQKAMYTKTHRGNGRFTTLIIPEDLDGDFKVETFEVKNLSGLEDSLINGAYFRITDQNTGEENYYFYYHINDETLKPENGVKIGDYTTDATTLVIQLNHKEEFTSVFVVNGSYVKSTSIGKYIFKTDKPTTVAYKKSGQFVNVLSSQYDDVEDVKGMQVYMPGVKAGRLDGENVKVNTENSILTFVGVSGESNIPSGSGSGGGGGGGAVTPKPPVKEDKTEEDVKPVEPVIPDVVTPSYEDVKENEWYYEYVEKLTSKGIISGDGSGKFSPNENVTREQFLKMLIEAMDIEAEEFENTFTDVADSWYKPYVLKAKNIGIVNGISDTEFGIGSYITRQDMAVMISRTIHKLGIEIVRKDVEEFVDDESVSDYAKESVMFMKSIGLVEGYNNEYKPLDNLTRAEAAKVICELLLIY